MTPSKKTKKEGGDKISNPQDLANGFTQTLGRLIAAEILDENMNANFEAFVESAESLPVGRVQLL